MKYDALILDMDGTLVDTERILIDLWDVVSREMGHVFAREVMVSTVGTTYEDTNRLMEATYPHAPHEAIRKESSKRFRELRERGAIPTMTGAAELLTAAKEKGLKIGVCTSTHRSSAEATLDRAGLLPYVQAMVCAGEAEAGKPDPAPYRLIAKRLGVAPERCAVVEDTAHGAHSALGAGMQVFLVPDMAAATEEIARRTKVLKTLFDVIPYI